MKKILFILVLLFGIGIQVDLAQTQMGGKKREKKVKTKRRGNFHLTQWKSMGHADDFARGNRGRRNIFTKLFKKQKPSWTYKSSGSKRSHFKDNQYLFTRNRTKGKVENSYYLDRQNHERVRTRERGNKVFKFKKYKRAK